MPETIITEPENIESTVEELPPAEEEPAIIVEDEISEPEVIIEPEPVLEPIAEVLPEETNSEEPASEQAVTL